MKIKIFATALLLTSLLLTSCTAKNESSMENTSMSIQDVPSAEEIKGWDMQKIYKLRSQIEQIPLESCEEYFTNELTEFFKQYENVDLGDITIMQDNLSLAKGKNMKPLRNLDLEIDIVIDMTGNVGSIEPAEDISEQLNDFLRQYSYLNLKTKILIINVLDSYHTKFYNVDSITSTSNETVFVEQPKDEYAVQTLAFSFSEKNPDFVLNKFGIIPESGELYVEYYVEDNYFDFSNLESSLADLEQICLDIKDHLLAQKITKEFAGSNGASLLTISFNSGNIGDNLTFHFDL